MEINPSTLSLKGVSFPMAGVSSLTPLFKPRRMRFTDDFDHLAEEKMLHRVTPVPYGVSVKETGAILGRARKLK